jgi:hypothetical protein
LRRPLLCECQLDGASELAGWTKTQRVRDVNEAIRHDAIVPTARSFHATTSLTDAHP